MLILYHFCRNDPLAALHTLVSSVSHWVDNTSILIHGRIPELAVACVHLLLGLVEPGRKRTIQRWPVLLLLRSHILCLPHLLVHLVYTHASLHRHPSFSASSVPIPVSPLINSQLPPAGLCRCCVCRRSSCLITPLRCIFPTTYTRATPLAFFLTDLELTSGPRLIAGVNIISQIQNSLSSASCVAMC